MVVHMRVHKNTNKTMILLHSGYFIYTNAICKMLTSLNILSHRMLRNTNTRKLPFMWKYVYGV